MSGLWNSIIIRSYVTLWGRLCPAQAAALPDNLYSPLLWSKLDTYSCNTKYIYKARNQHCCAIVFIAVRFPHWGQWAMAKSTILGGVFSTAFPTERECLNSCRQMDRACRITFAGEKPALKSFDSRRGIWSISIEMSSLSFIFCQLPISS